MSTLQPQLINKYGRTEAIINERLHFDLQGRIATDLATRWGIVAAIEDGEDSSGRQKQRLMTPQELVNRAMETAKLLVEAAKANNLTILLDELPAPTKEED